MDNVNSPSYLQNIFKKNGDKEMLDFDQKADKIMGAISVTLKEIETIRKSLDQFKGKKGIGSFVKKIEETENLSKKFLTPKEDLTPKEVKKMVDLYDSIEKFLVTNQKSKVGDKTLKEVIESYQRDENARVSFSASLSNRLAKLSSRMGMSAKEFLVDNAKEISLKGEKQNIGVAAISSFSPVAGLVAKMVTDAVDLNPLYDSTKKFLGGVVKDTKSALFGGKKALGKKEDPGSEMIKGTLDTQYTEKEEIEEKRHKELIETIEGTRKKGGLFGDGGNTFFGGGIGKTLKKLGKLALKGAGVAAGAYGLYDAYTGIKERKGESFFGTGEGEKGFMGSRAMRYGEGALSGAAAGMALGGPIGALIGGGIGVISTLWADQGDKIVEMFKTMPEWLGKKFDGLVDWFKDLPEKIIAGIAGVFGKGKQFVKAGYEKSKEFVKTAAPKVTSFIKDGLNDITSFLLGDPELKKAGIRTKADAAAIAGNLAHESGLVSSINEKNPLVAGSRGGFGLAQWTGDRRKKLEAFAKQKGMDVGSKDLQLQFLKQELLTTHKGALSALASATTPEEKTIAFEQKYEGAGIKHYGSRIAYTKAALGETPTASVANNNTISSSLETPSLQSVAQENTNNRLDSIQKSMSVQQTSNMSMPKKEPSATQKIIDMKKSSLENRYQKQNMSFPSYNLSPDTYISGLQLGIT